MSLIELFNKAFPEPKPRKRKKQNSWVPNPNYWFNQTYEALVKSKKRKTKDRIERLIKQKYIRKPGESNEKKIKRERSIDKEISELAEYDKSGLKKRNFWNLLERRLDESHTSWTHFLQKRGLKKDPSFKLPENLVLPYERLMLTGAIYNFNEQDVMDMSVKFSEVSNLGKFSDLPKDKKEDIAEEARKILRSRVKEIRERQIMSIEPWRKYLSQMASLSDRRFEIFVLGSILRYDYDWLTKNPDNSWKTGIRSKKTEKPFPVFETDVAPVVLAKMRELYAYVDMKEFKTIGPMVAQANPELSPDHPFRIALDKGDFREMYFALREEVLLSRIDEKDVLERVNMGWTRYSTEHATTQDEKMEVANQVAIATRYSRGFCIKAPSTALYSYLEKGKGESKVVGDIYLFAVRKLVMKPRENPDVPETEQELETRKKNAVWLEVPEVAIHIIRHKDGTESVNAKEVHGNIEGQGIAPEYLQIAKDFVMQKKKDANGNDTEEFRFSNAAELGIKFADTVMYNRVKAKIDNLGKIDPETRELQKDLEPNELKFLYQIYRPVEGFELNNIGSLRYKVKELKQRRLWALNPVHFEQASKTIFVTEGEKLAVADAQQRKDFEKMFTGFMTTSTLGIVVKTAEVVDGGGPISIVEMYPNVKEIVGPLVISRGHSVKLPIKLQKINGIVLNNVDRHKIENSQIKEFPVENDPRLTTVYLEN